MKGVDSNISRWTRIGAEKLEKLSDCNETSGFIHLQLHQDRPRQDIKYERLHYKEWIQTLVTRLVHAQISYKKRELEIILVVSNI